MKRLWRLVLALLGVLLLSGCDPVVSRTPMGDVYTTERMESCYRSGFCYDNGKYGFSTTCTGHRRVRRYYQKELVRFESGKISLVEQLVDREPLTNCR